MPLERLGRLFGVESTGMLPALQFLLNINPMEAMGGPVGGVGRAIGFAGRAGGAAQRGSRIKDLLGDVRAFSQHTKASYINLLADDYRRIGGKKRLVREISNLKVHIKGILKTAKKYPDEDFAEAIELADTQLRDLLKVKRVLGY